MSTSLQQVEQIYLAFYGRPADPAGLHYWGDILTTDPSATPTIAATFANTPEYAANFGGKTNAAIVDTMFVNLFGHSADATVRANYSSQLDTGTNIGIVLNAILSAAQASDRATLDAKAAAAAAFTGALDTTAEVAAYTAQAGMATAKEYIAYVDDANSLLATTTPYALNLVTADIVSGSSWSMPSQVDQQVQELYVAYFARPGDPAGDAFWSEALDGNPANPHLADISAAFALSAEYRSMYGQSTNALKVAAVYQNLFSRTAETAGVNYWADLMSNGTLTLDNVVTAIASGAQTTDLYAYRAKVSVARAFTDALDTPLEQAAYAGATALATVSAYIAAVKDQGSYNAAIAPASIDALINSISGNPGPVPPGTYSDSVQLVGIAPAEADGMLF